MAKLPTLRRADNPNSSPTKSPVEFFRERRLSCHEQHSPQTKTPFPTEQVRKFCNREAYIPWVPIFLNFPDFTRDRPILRLWSPKTIAFCCGYKKQMRTTCLSKLTYRIPTFRTCMFCFREVQTRALQHLTSLHERLLSAFKTYREGSEYLAAHRKSRLPNFPQPCQRGEARDLLKRGTKHVRMLISWTFVWRFPVNTPRHARTWFP